jgi:hypothetical protein
LGKYDEEEAKGKISVILAHLRHELPHPRKMLVILPFLMGLMPSHAERLTAEKEENNYMRLSAIHWAAGNGDNGVALLRGGVLPVLLPFLWAEKVSAFTCLTALCHSLLHVNEAIPQFLSFVSEYLSRVLPSNEGMNTRYCLFEVAVCLNDLCRLMDGSNSSLHGEDGQPEMIRQFCACGIPALSVRFLKKLTSGTANLEATRGLASLFAKFVCRFAAEVGSGTDGRDAIRDAAGAGADAEKSGAGAEKAG